MKLKKLSNLKYKLIKLELIKFKFMKTDIQQLKKALLVIFQYHVNNKKILFLGENSHKKTKHLFLPEFYWIKGLLTNKVTLFKYIKKRVNLFRPNKVKNYFLLKKKPDLIVLLNIKLQPLVEMEANKLKIPVIVLSTEKKKSDSLLHSIFKKNKLNV